jgi:hypothetical protein
LAILLLLRLLLLGKASCLDGRKQGMSVHLSWLLKPWHGTHLIQQDADKSVSHG